MPNAFFAPVSAATEAGRGLPMAGSPTAEMVASAVTVPMTEIMRGEMMPKAVVAEIMMIAVLIATPIKGMKMPAKKSVTEGGAEAGMRPAAVGRGVDLRANYGKKASHSDSEVVAQIRSHSQAPRISCRHIMGVREREFDRLADRPIRIVKP